MKILLTILIAFCFLNANNNIYYHKLRLSDSSPVVEKWNVNVNDVGKYYVIETVDSLNRVIELRFIKDGKLFLQSCYVTPIIKYEYKNDDIITYFYKNENELRTELECGDFQKTIYYIENNEIINCKNYITDLYFLNSLDTTKTENKEYYNYMLQYKNGKIEECFGISGFSYSLKKLNGKDFKKY